MSKRCELQKEYYKSNGNYKGNGNYSDEYVSWLEEQILALRIHNVSGSFSEKDLERAWTAGRAHYGLDLTFEQWLKNYR